MPKHRFDDYTIGVFYAVICYLSWGMFPLFWKQFEGVDAFQILAHRILWSFVFLFFVFVFTRHKELLLTIKQPKTWMWLSLTSVLIAINWVVYIYAVSNNHIIESSFGYYINPLMNVLLGMVVLKEKLPKLQIIALILALCGILVISIRIGRVPIISLILATSFAFYGLFRKMANINSMIALFIETLILLPLSLFWIFYLQHKGSGVFGIDLRMSILFILGGIATAIPLLWFGMATRRIPLSTIGFIQYLSPSIQLIVGVIIYKEQFSSSHFIGFGFVWAALIIFSLSLYNRYKK